MEKEAEPNETSDLVALVACVGFFLKTSFAAYFVCVGTCIFSLHKVWLTTMKLIMTSGWAIYSQFQIFTSQSMLFISSIHSNLADASVAHHSIWWCYMYTANCISVFERWQNHSKICTCRYETVLWVILNRLEIQLTTNEVLRNIYFAFAASHFSRSGKYFEQIQPNYNNILALL